MTKMLPAFEKKPNWFVKRENQNWWESNALKNVSNATEAEHTVGDRDRAKNSKSRLSRPFVARHESLQSLPTIREPLAEATLRTAPANVTMNDECSQSCGSRNENLRVCIKRWKRVSLNRATASSIHFEPLECFRRLARIVMVVIRIGRVLKSDPKAVFHQEGICKSFLEIMEGYMATRERHLTNNHHKPGFSSAALVFDPKQFKANKEVKISKEVKQLLSSRPEERTSDQLQTVLYALQTLESFSELPLHMQQDVCKVAWLQSLPPNKIIIKQDHVADNFYFIINGTVTVLSENDPTKDSPFTSLATLKRGSSFGETAILNNCRRTASVVSNDPIQLLVIEKEDYQRIFMGQTKTGEEPAHLKFCRSLDFLADWPVDLLLANPENCLFHYFRRGTVIVKDSNKSDWLYIIVSGVCQVLLKLEITKPRLSGKVQNREELTTADKLANLTEERHRNSSYSASKIERLPTRRNTTAAFSSSRSMERRTKSLPPVFPVTEVPSTFHHQPRKQTAFVQLGLLHPRSVFGLSTLLNFDEDFQLLQQASVSLVSRGAECVMISKKFFITQASELTKKWIRHNVRSYPSRETLQRNLQERINWDAYKQDVIQTVIAR
ncbi:uncharacterized protein LOC144655264 isoform X1 [Oculina patagonica]